MCLTTSHGRRRLDGTAVAAAPSGDGEGLRFVGAGAEVHVLARAERETVRGPVNGVAERAAVVAGAEVRDVVALVAEFPRPGVAVAVAEGAAPREFDQRQGDPGSGGAGRAGVPLDVRLGY